MKGLKLVAICGECGEVNKYIKHNKDIWIYLEKHNRKPINEGKGAWFCSKKCKELAIARWDKEPKWRKLMIGFRNLTKK